MPEPQRSRASLSALRPILPYARKLPGRIALALVALLVASLATLVVPYAIREMVDRGFHGGGEGSVHLYFALLIVVVAVLALASGSRYYLVMTIGERIVADLRSDFFRHLTTLDQTFFDAEKTGEIVSRLSADTTQLKATFGSSASIALRNIFMFVGAIALMIVTSLKLSAYVLIAIPFIVLPLYAAGRSVRERSRLAQQSLADATAFASENLDAARVMQAFVAEDFTARRYATAAEGAYEAAREMTRARSVVTAIAIFLAFSSVVVVLWLGARDVIEHRMSAGALLQFLLYAVLGASALGQLSEVWNEVSQAAGAATRIGELMALKPAIVAPAQPARLPSPLRGALAFERVTFAYPARPRRRGAARRRFRRRARRDGRHRRPLGRRQIDAVPASGALLRPDLRRRAARWRRHRRTRPENAATRHRARPAGGVHLRCERRRQHRLRPARRDAARDRGGGPPRRRAWLRRRAARRATTRRSASAASTCRAASASASPSPAPF